MNNIQYTRIGDLGMRLKFLNGEIVVPDEYGGYVIAPGCRSGKTTAIKQIIKENYKTGILYSTFTIEECNEMYEYCKSLVNPDDPEGLKKDDIVVLHSDYKSEGTDNNIWRNDPEKLMDKRIIICTHQKLMNEDPRPLTSTSFNHPLSEVGLDKYTYSVCGGFRSEFLPRRYIILDEVPDSDNFKGFICKRMRSSVIVLDSNSSIYQDTIEIESREFSKENSDCVFKFQDLRITYPKIIKSNDSVVNLESKTLDESSHIGSRSDRLSTRSHQEDLFDLLIRVNYFNRRVYREIIIPTRTSYIIVDYYFPDNRLVVELDSDLHDEEKDLIRDRYLNSLGLGVLRFKEFKGTEDELKSLNLVLEDTDGLEELEFDFSYRSTKFILPNLTTKALISDRLEDMIPKYDKLSGTEIIPTDKPSGVGIIELVNTKTK